MSPSIRYRAPARLSWASGRWEIDHCEVYVRRLGVTLDSLSRRLRAAPWPACCGVATLVLIIAALS